MDSGASHPFSQPEVRKEGQRRLRRKWHLPAVIALLLGIMFLFGTASAVYSQNDPPGWFEDFNGEVHIDDDCVNKYSCGEIRGPEDVNWRIINWVQRFKDADGLSTHFHPANVRVNSGILEMATGGRENRSAQVELARPAGYGYYEASIAFSEIPFEPEREGVEGATNAFFLYNHEAYQNREPFEIDIEYNTNNKNSAINGAKPGLFFTVHSFEREAGGGMKEKAASFRPDLEILAWVPGGFNRVGICRVPGYAAFYVNGHFAGAICRENAGGIPCAGKAAIPAGEMVLILNHWSNNERFNGLEPSKEAVMRVDSVSYTPAADISQCPRISYETKPAPPPEDAASPTPGEAPDSAGQPLDPPPAGVDPAAAQPGVMPTFPVCLGSLFLLLAAALMRRTPGG